MTSGLFGLTGYSSLSGGQFPPIICRRRLAVVAAGQALLGRGQQRRIELAIKKLHKKRGDLRRCWAKRGRSNERARAQ